MNRITDLMTSIQDLLTVKRQNHEEKHFEMS